MWAERCNETHVYSSVHTKSGEIMIKKISTSIWMSLMSLSFFPLFFLFRFNRPLLIGWTSYAVITDYLDDRECMQNVVYIR